MHADVRSQEQSPANKTADNIKRCNSIDPTSLMAAQPRKTATAGNYNPRLLHRLGDKSQLKPNNSQATQKIDLNLDSLSHGFNRVNLNQNIKGFVKKTSIVSQNGSVNPQPFQGKSIQTQKSGSIWNQFEDMSLQ